MTIRGSRFESGTNAISCMYKILQDLLINMYQIIENRVDGALLKRISLRQNTINILYLEIMISAIGKHLNQI